MLTLRYVQKYTFRVTVERLLHHKSRSVGTPGVNLVSKCAGDTRGKSHERRAQNFEWYRRTVKITTGGGHNGPPPPPGKLGLTMLFPFQRCCSCTYSDLFVSAFRSRRYKNGCSQYTWNSLPTYYNSTSMPTKLRLNKMAVKSGYL